MDRLQSMRVFEQVVAEGGFAAAARKLDLSPPAVTRLIGDLEASLGVRLLHRSSRKLSLTQAGEIYLARLGAILADIDEAQEVVKAHTRDMSGTLRLSTTPTAAVNLLAPCVAAFQLAHPGVSVEIHATERPAEEVDQFDITFVPETGQLDADVVVRPVIVTDMVLCGSSDYLRRNGVPRAPEELAQHRVARLQVSGTRLRPLQMVNREEGGRTVEINAPATFWSNDFDTVSQAGLEGAGLALFPELTLTARLQNGVLQRVLVPWVSVEPLRLVAAMPSRRFMPVRARAFLEFSVDFLKRPQGERIREVQPREAA